MSGADDERQFLRIQVLEGKPIHRIGIGHAADDELDGGSAQKLEEVGARTALDQSPAGE